MLTKILLSGGYTNYKFLAFSIHVQCNDNKWNLLLLNLYIILNMDSCLCANNEKI